MFDKPTRLTFERDDKFSRTEYKTDSLVVQGSLAAVSVYILPIRVRRCVGDRRLHTRYEWLPTLRELLKPSDWSNFSSFVLIWVEKALIGPYIVFKIYVFELIQVTYKVFNALSLKFPGTVDRAILFQQSELILLLPLGHKMKRLC